MNIKSILNKGLGGLKSAWLWIRQNWRDLPLLWLLLAFFLLVVIIMARFPTEKIIGKILTEQMAKTELNLTFEEMDHSFPFDFSFKSLALKNKKGGEFSFFDADLDLNWSIAFMRSIDLELTSSGFNYRDDKIFFRSNMKLNVEAEQINEGLSKITGKLSLVLKQIDFSDIRALIKASPKTKMIADLLGEKIPKKLTFSEIHLLATLSKKVLKIQKADIKGKEITGSIKGKINLREDSFMNSPINLEILILKKSAIWKRFETEKELLKSLKIFDAQGNLKIPIRGSLKSPRVDLSFKMSLPTSTPAIKEGG